MKLSIRSSIISSLTDFLKEFDENKEYKFLFGKRTRTSFVPYFNLYDFKKIKTNLESSLYLLIQTEHKKYCNIIDIGIINNYYVTFGYSSNESSSQNYLTYISPDSSYSIFLLEDDDKCQIEISIIKKPNSLSELFELVKVIYRFLESPLIKDENKEVISSYNSLFDKEGNKPWIVPQGLSYLKIDNLEEIRNCIICPMRRGKSRTLFLCEFGGYLFGDGEVYRVSTIDVPEMLYNTVISGDWFEDYFYAYDISVFNRTDIRTQSIIKRLKYIKIVLQKISFCKKVQYIKEDISNIRKFIYTYGGVIFAPIRANYTNIRTYIYQPIENVCINFNLSHNNLRYKTCTLKTGKENYVFSGNIVYPFFNTIPLSKEDNEFIGNNEGVFEFKWRDNNLIPMSYLSCNDLTSTLSSKSIWTYINEPIKLSLILSNLN